MSDELVWHKHDGGPMPVPGDTVVRCRWNGRPINPNNFDAQEIYGWDTDRNDTRKGMWVEEYAIVIPSPNAGVAVEDQADAYGTLDAHYTKHAIEPMEYSMANKLDAMQHTVVKYVTRFRDKHGKRDLLAARHVIDMLIAREYPNG